MSVTRNIQSNDSLLSRKSLPVENEQRIGTVVNSSTHQNTCFGCKMLNSEGMNFCQGCGNMMIISNDLSDLRSFDSAPLLITSMGENNGQMILNKMETPSNMDPTKSLIDSKEFSVNSNKLASKHSKELEKC